MIAIGLAALLALGIAVPAAARDAPWVIATPALAEIGADLAGARARIESRADDEDAVTAYCKGLGAQAADALLITRRLLDRERKSCEAEAISADPERVLGIVGLTLEGAPPGVTRRHLWRALAREVPIDGKLAPNRVRSWREVDPDLPDRPIALRLAAPVPLVDALMLSSGCLGAAGYAKLDRKRLCRGLREDLPAGPDPLVVRTLGSAGDQVEGIPPAGPEIAAGRYPLARRVYLYVKRPHLPGIPGLSGLLSRDAGALLTSP
jgi:phosphate transport system substrate-binding protein